MNTKLMEKKQKVKRSAIKDLTQFKYEFREAAEPLTHLLEKRTAYLEHANEKTIPYILSDIQNLSEGITNLEALFGKLMGYYCDLGDKCIFLESQWKGASEILTALRHDYQVLKVKEWNRNNIANHKNQGECQ